MAGADAAREAVYWRSFLSELGFEPSRPTLIKSDNQGSIALTKNAMHHARTKHIDVKHHWIRELVASHQIEVLYVSTEHMVADALTKPLARESSYCTHKGDGLAPTCNFIGTTVEWECWNRHRSVMGVGRHWWSAITCRPVSRTTSIVAVCAVRGAVRTTQNAHTLTHHH